MNFFVRLFYFTKFVVRKGEIEMNEITIRKATIEDVVAILTIKVKGWQTAYKNII